MFEGTIGDLIKTVWEKRHVPQEWVSAILIPIPKKGNLHCCDNWRGIALLMVVGKVVARVIQNKVAETSSEGAPKLSVWL